MAGEEDSSFFEYKQRVIYSLFLPAARIGIKLRIPLKQFLDLAKMAYFAEAKETQGLKIHEISDLFGRSLRSVGGMHRRFRGDFFAPEQELQFRRDITSVIAKGPKTFEGLCKAFPARSSTEIAQAVGDLVQEDRIFEQDGSYTRNAELQNFYSSTDVGSRITGLNRHMEIVGNTIWDRLLSKQSSNDSTARSWVFPGGREAISDLLGEIVELVRTRSVSIEKDALEENTTDETFGITLSASRMESSE